MNPITFLTRSIFPPKCPFCREIIRHTVTPPCDACRDNLPLIPDGGAGLSLPPLTAYIAPMRYDGLARDALVALKFKRGFSAVKPVAALMAEAVRRRGVAVDLVTWPPLSKQRMRERGFDQAELLAAELCKRLGRPKPVRLLKKQQQRAVQSSLKDDNERRANASGAYIAVNAGPIQGKHILLVDDIGTSGATLCECAGVLLQAGAAAVSAVVGACRGG